jgi:hypothetical protein
LTGIKYLQGYLNHQQYLYKNLLQFTKLTNVDTHRVSLMVITIGFFQSPLPRTAAAFFGFEEKCITHIQRLRFIKNKSRLHMQVVACMQFNIYIPKGELALGAHWSAATGVASRSVSRCNFYLCCWLGARE